MDDFEHIQTNQTQSMMKEGHFIFILFKIDVICFHQIIFEYKTSSSYFLIESRAWSRGACKLCYMSSNSLALASASLNLFSKAHILFQNLYYLFPFIYVTLIACEIHPQLILNLGMFFPSSMLYQKNPQQMVLLRSYRLKEELSYRSL